MPSAGGTMPLLNYQPALYQQATINIPGLAQQSVPIPTRPAGLCSQTEPFQQTLIVCPPSTIQGKGKGCNQTEKRLVLEISFGYLHVYSTSDTTVSVILYLSLL